MDNFITVEEAKKRLLDGEVIWRSFANNEPLFDDQYLEAEYCWVFFRNPHILLPENALLGINWAYAVSKKGSTRMVYDLRNDSKKMTEHLQSLSNHFKEKNI